MRSANITVKRARALRREMTAPEVMLWSRLRRRLDDGAVFRRQHALGPYILDFFCARARLAVEIDGAGHSEPAQAAHDRRRDAWLRSNGVEVYRIPAGAVFSDLANVADGVRRRALERIAAEAWKAR
ncbi:MAG: DUF559 domain-containing protein [Phenylobacterium sp.]|nr:MAG: DUF559 domain-containing protein [Phenylobacterium sp.]